MDHGLGGEKKENYLEAETVDGCKSFPYWGSSIPTWSRR